MTFPNLKVKGILSTHRIRRPTHPVIDDITSDSKSLNKKKEIEEPKWEEPRYTLVMEPPEDPEFIVVEVQLPKVVWIYVLITLLLNKISLFFSRTRSLLRH